MTIIVVLLFVTIVCADGLFGDRCTASEVRKQLLAEMLQIMDGAVSCSGGTSLTHGIFVVGATNNQDRLDSALLRPGRFDRLIYLPPPSLEQRKQILQVGVKIILANNLNL